MHQIDDSFKLQKERSRERRRKQRTRRIAQGGVAILVLGVVAAGALTAPYWWPERKETPEASEKPKPAEPAAQQTAVYVPAIVDLPGDPLTINLGRGQGPQKLKAVSRPVDLVDEGIADNLEMLSDTMVSSSERFMTTLPSTPQDFAFFQAQSARNRDNADAAGATDGAADDMADDDADTADDQDDDSAAENSPYGADLDISFNPVASQNDGSVAAPAAVPTLDTPEADSPDGGAAQPGEGPEAVDAPDHDVGGAVGAGPPPAADAKGAQPGGTPPASTAQPPVADAPDQPGEPGASDEETPQYKKTAIDNTTTVREVTREVDRFARIEDVMVRVLGDRTLDSILTEHNFSRVDAKNAGEALKAQFGIETLGSGTVVAMRGYRTEIRATSLQLVQVSINAGGKYVGTLALSDSGGYVSGADPWVDQDLLNYSEPTAQSDQPKRRYRLLDAIYSTAARNNVPTGVIGEIIMLMSRTFDLNAFASPDDKLIVVYSKSPRDQAHNTGRVLYAAIKGSDNDLQCFVYRARPGGEFSCMTDKDQTHAVTVSNGMVTPVTGVLSAPFGPSRRPGSKKVRINKGVDWAAPLGTPVLAAFDGTVSFAGDNKGYGNFIRIDHGHGKVTGYAHLDHFAAGIAKGSQVQAGDIIGFVGNTGDSDGPHLHFELYRNGKAINPLGSTVAEDSDGSAVAILVNKIIGVESGHNARAKNPLSSATGLGQFIESTWIRMMNTYRPELARSLSRSDLLDLRFDPTLSREMVGNLARENEAYLKSNGNTITAGRLYLAHFLGPEGANTVLSASPDALLSTVLGDAVIRANPFLTGKTASYVIGWAEAKMHGRHGGGGSEQRIVKVSPEFVQYRTALETLISSQSANL